MNKSHGRSYPEPPRADELPTLGAVEAAPLVARDSRGRVTDADAARKLASRPRAGAFLPRKVTSDPRFEVHSRRRLDWLKARRDELYAATGGVSHGVGAMLNAAAWLWAGGEYAAERAAETVDVDMFKLAASLTTTARGHDLAAWEMAVREGEARAKAHPQDHASKLLSAFGMPAPTEGEKP